MAEAGSLGKRHGELREAVILCERSGKMEEEICALENQSDWVPCDRTAAMERTKP